MMDKKQIFKNAQKHLDDLHELLPYQQFYDHIKAHLNDNQVVICTICGKTYDEIVKESHR